MDTSSSSDFRHFSSTSASTSETCTGRSGHSRRTASSGPSGAPTFRAPRSERTSSPLTVGLHSTRGSYLSSRCGTASRSSSIEHERKEVNMCGRHRNRMWRWRAPSRDELLRMLEERQKDLEQEIADIHDLIGRLRDEGAAPTSPEPA